MATTSGNAGRQTSGTDTALLNGTLINSSFSGALPIGQRGRQPMTVTTAQGNMLLDSYNNGGAWREISVVPNNDVVNEMQKLRNRSERWIAVNIGAWDDAGEQPKAKAQFAKVTDEVRIFFANTVGQPLTETPDDETLILVQCVPTEEDVESR